MVSPWMENGNILEYTSRNPGVNRLHLVIHPRWCPSQETEDGHPAVGRRSRWTRVSAPWESGAREYSRGTSPEIYHIGVLDAAFFSQIF